MELLDSTTALDEKTPRPAPVRVLFVNDHLGFDGGAIHGIARWLEHVLPRFDTRTIEPHLCILRGWHPHAKVLERQGIRTIFLGRAKWDPRVLADLVRLVRGNDIHVLHLMGLKAILLGRAASRLARCKAVIHIRDMVPLSMGMRLAQRMVGSWTSRAIAISPPVVEFALSQFSLPRDKVFLLPHGLDVRHFAAAGPDARARVRSELALPLHAQVVGIVGRVKRVKGHEVLLRAMRRVRQMLPEAYLLVVGTGPDLESTEALARRLDLSDRVRFAGHRDDIPDVLAAVDVVAMPSVWEEAFGLASLEAIAAGRPVVAFDTGGLRLTVLDGKTGLVVPKGDEVGLASALSAILTDSALAERLGAGARLHAQKFAVDRYVRTLTDMYLSLV